MELSAGLYCKQCFRAYTASEFEVNGKKCKLCKSCREYMRVWSNNRYHDKKDKINDKVKDNKKQCTGCFKVKELTEFRQIGERYTKMCGSCRAKKSNQRKI